MKKGGRPRLDPMTKRNRTIGVRVSQKELEDIEAKAREMGLPVGTWLRVAGQSRQLPRPPVPAVNRDLYAGLGRIGNVLNQVVRTSHRGRVKVDPTLLQEVLTVLHAVRLELLGLSTPGGVVK